MTQCNRRAFFQGNLLGAAGLLAGRNLVHSDEGPRESFTHDLSCPIVLHQTDLFHPHADPDDHFDLAVVFALALQGYIDLRGVILDYPVMDWVNGDPAVVAVAQMNRICGSHVPGVVGSRLKMRTADDRLDDAPARELAAVHFILDVLRRAERPVRFKCGSSAPDVAVAALREPDLFREKCAGLYVNCGSAFPNPNKPDEEEYNITANRAGQAALFNDVPCPVYWFPCWHTTLDWKMGGNATYFEGAHELLLNEASPALRYFMYYMFSHSQDVNWMRNMENGVEDDPWFKMIRTQNNGARSLWATTSLFMLANRTVTRDGDIVATDEVDPNDALYRLENIHVKADDRGRITWNYCDEESNRKIFHVLDDEKYCPAMLRATNTLLKTLI
ncbi:MAG: hypothetical protein Q4G68_00630 [Planctomycetia bacterium]|nr:hypothetical protein [Planctomycetia bacterium]